MESRELISLHKIDDNLMISRPPICTTPGFGAKKLVSLFFLFVHKMGMVKVLWCGVVVSTWARCLS
jgi:hypothetical protein